MRGRRKGADGERPTGEQPLRIAVDRHPRARAQVRRAKALAGLGAFVLALALSLRAGVPAWDAGLRALAAGVAGYLAAWAVAVAVWRQLILGEIELQRERWRAQRDPANAAERGV